MNRLEKIEERLFFIVGCGRSGTTLLKTMLNSHKNISIPHETFFFNSITNSLQEPEISTEFKLQVLKSKWWIQEMNPDFMEIQGLLPEKCASWSRVFLALMSEITNKDAQMVGEKTPSHILKSSEILEEFKDAKIIQIVRDPRAVFRSFKNTTVGTNQIATCLLEWEESILVGLKLRKHPRYTCVKFEDLLLNPKDTLSTLCTFLDIEYDTRMLEFYKRSVDGFSMEQSHHRNTTHPIFTSNLNAWNFDITKNQIAIIEHKLSSHMQKFDYELKGFKTFFPQLQLFLSEHIDKIHKTCVRKPKQYLKKRRAQKRMRFVKKEN